MLKGGSPGFISLSNQNYKKPKQQQQKGKDFRNYIGVLSNVNQVSSQSFRQTNIKMKGECTAIEDDFWDLSLET